MKLLTILIVGYLLLAFVHYTVSFFWDYTLFSGAVILEKWLRSKLIAHFLKMSPPFF